MAPDKIPRLRACYSQNILSDDRFTTIMRMVNEPITTNWQTFSDNATRMRPLTTTYTNRYNNLANNNEHFSD